MRKKGEKVRKEEDTVFVVMPLFPGAGSRLLACRTREQAEGTATLLRLCPGFDPETEQIAIREARIISKGGEDDSN